MAKNNEDKISIKCTKADLNKLVEDTAMECHGVQTVLWIGIIGMYFTPGEAREILEWAGKVLHENYNEFATLAKKLQED